MYWLKFSEPSPTFPGVNPLSPSLYCGKGLNGFSAVLRKYGKSTI